MIALLFEIVKAASNLAPIATPDARSHEPGPDPDRKSFSCRTCMPERVPSPACRP
jgi:hypothetical protein